METIIRTAPLKGEIFINKDDLMNYLNEQICLAETLSARSIVKGIISDLKNGEKNG